MTVEMQEWQRNLAAHTGQWAFVLSLSRNMVFVLRQVRDNTFTWSKPGARQEQRKLREQCGIRYDIFVPGIKSLINRGLVQHIERPKDAPMEVPSFVLTPAGIAVCYLLVYAELMPKQRVKAGQRVEEPA